MRIASWNVNGIRSVAGKGFLDWFERSEADIVCLQEIKARPEQLDESLRHPGKFHSIWRPADKPGYSGVAVYTRHEPLAVREGLGIPEFDIEGRVLEIEFRDFVLLNTYFPNSQREHGRLPYKLNFCAAVLARLETLRRLGKHAVICGDFNIAHKEIDLRNPRANINNAGFLPAERAWMDLFIDHAWVDAFRNYELGGDHYTWWSYRPGVRARNIGWRLDYFFVNSEMINRLRSTRHEPEVMGSDHCPVILELKR